MVIFLQKTFFFCIKCLAVMLKLFIFAPVLSNDSAEIAQLVEHNLAKVGVASSSLVFRSNGCSNGGIGRHEGLKIPWPLRLCGFKSRFEYEIKSQLSGQQAIAIFILYTCTIFAPLNLEGSRYFARIR